MLQPFKRNFLQHALAVSQWMKSVDARGGMDPRTLAMEISLGGKAVRFVPQFVTENEGGMIGFTPELVFNVSGFVGWYPISEKPGSRHRTSWRSNAMHSPLGCAYRHGQFAWKRSRVLSW